MNHPKENPQASDVSQLLEALVDDPLNNVARGELEQLLAGDEAHRQAYVEQVIIHTSLQWQHSSPLPGEGGCGIDAAVQPSNTPSRPARGAWLSRGFWLPAMAASVLVAVLSIALQRPQPQPPLATVTRLLGVEFAEQSPAFTLGQQLREQTVNIESGQLEMVFSSGATVLLHEKTEVEILNPLLMRLVRGQVTSTVSENAVGFKVITPNLEVIDLGTEFGVEVDDTGSTDVVVFSGQVRLERDSRGLPGVDLLTEGQGVRVKGNDEVDRIGQIRRDGRSRGWVTLPSNVDASTSGHVIASVSDNLLLSESKEFYEVVYRGFEEDARAYVDRIHEWNGMDQGGLPSELVGADYIRTFNNDKFKDDFQISVTLAKPCRFFILWDPRCEPPAWLLKDFRRTEMVVGLDEGPRPHFVLPLGVGAGKEVDKRHEVWEMEVATPRTVHLGPLGSDYLGEHKTMYGMAAKAMSNQEVAEVVARRKATSGLETRARPKDKRAGRLRDLNRSHFGFSPPDSAAAWEERREKVKRRVLVATGLWPLPEATPAGAVVHGLVDREEYTVEKVFFESYPGHYVTGNLYRPKGFEGPRPGVLCPHGHWHRGRFYSHSDDEMRKALETGAELDEVGGRFPLQARCVQLARMGCVVFHYDMVGYADSRQLPHSAGGRGNPSLAAGWGFSSPQAELRLQNEMGLQTYNSIRALDWLTTLPDVDTERIGVTGASGGGTQTFVLCAIDDRPKVAVPAVMVSTAMQGGCTCENAPYLRIGTGNVEIAALLAPRPLGLIAADDWTRDIQTDGLPELQRIYRLLGAEENVMAKSYTQFPHNYNYVSRTAMYQWLNTHLGLEQTSPIVERAFEPLTIEEMSVWNSEHPAPPGDDKYERKLLDFMWKQAQQQLSQSLPKDYESLAAFRRVVGGGWDVLLRRGVPEPGSVTMQDQQSVDRDDYTTTTFLLNYAPQGEQVPALLLEPTQEATRTAIWVSTTGIQSMFVGDDLVPEVEKLLRGGVAVLGVDLYGQGAFTSDGKPVTIQRYKAASDQPHNKTFSGYMYGYNDPLFCQRVHDILTAVAFARDELSAGAPIDLVGLDGAGHWVAAARAQAGPLVDRAVIDPAGFRFEQVTSLVDADFVPGSVKYFGLPGLLALGAPHDTCLLVTENDDHWRLVRDAFRAAGAAGRLRIVTGAPRNRGALGIEWLLSESEPGVEAAGAGR